MCCTRLAENTGHKNSPSAHHHTTLSCHVFATKAYIDSRKNNWLNSNISSTSFHSMTNFGPLTTEIGWRVWASQQISTYFPTSLNGGQPKFARCLAVSWDDVPCIHFKFFFGGGGSFPLTGFCQVQNSLCVQVLRSLMLSALLHGARAVAGAAITLGIGPESSCL